jgi:hypothetical protein
LYGEARLGFPHAVEIEFVLGLKALKPSIR